jgi:hypothetical protein
VIGALVGTLFVFALYRLFNSESPAVSLAGAVLGIGGALLLAVLVVLNGAQNNSIQNLVLWAAFMSPPLFFGWLAYRHPDAGIPRALALIGLVGGVFGLLNLIVTLIAGGDWSNPNNPALSPVILGTYYLGMLPTLVWMLWSGIVLLKRKV